MTRYRRLSFLKIAFLHHCLYSFEYRLMDVENIGLSMDFAESSLQDMICSHIVYMYYADLVSPPLRHCSYAHTAIPGPGLSSESVRC